MDPSFSFNLSGGPGVRVDVVQLAGGKLRVTATVNAASQVGDLRGLFFHVSDQSLLGGLSITGATSPVGTVQQSANAVSNLGGGVSMVGPNAPLDVGIAFGTASIVGADDIRSVSFTLEHSTQSLSLALLQQMAFGAGAVLTRPSVSGRERVPRTACWTAVLPDWHPDHPCPPVRRPPRPPPRTAPTARWGDGGAPNDAKQATASPSWPSATTPEDHHLQRTACWTAVLPDWSPTPRTTC
ncbi:MAG: hypothetical protein U1F56_01515 [Rubrivivax sp.]